LRCAASNIARGFYAQPRWLISTPKAGRTIPARVRAKELWRVAHEILGHAQDDATLLAIRDRSARASTSSRTARCGSGELTPTAFENALEGVDIDNPGTALDRSGPQSGPRVAGKVRSGMPSRCATWHFWPYDRHDKMTVPVP